MISAKGGLCEQLKQKCQPLHDIPIYPTIFLFAPWSHAAERLRFAKPQLASRHAACRHRTTPVEETVDEGGIAAGPGIFFTGNPWKPSGVLQTCQ